MNKCYKRKISSLIIAAVLCSILMVVKPTHNVSNIDTTSNNTFNNELYYDTLQYQRDTISTLTIENLYIYIQLIDVEHPDIVFAQAVLETGYLSSQLCNDANNLFGMRMPRVRETLATESYKGYAKFDSWKDSVNDYLLWQSRFACDKTRDEYFAYLSRVYAEDKTYVTKLNKIIERHQYTV